MYTAFFCVGWHCCCCCRCCRHCYSCTLLLHSIMLFLLPSPAAMMFAVYSCKMNVNLYKLSQTHTERDRKTDSVKPFNKEKTICFHILLHEFHRIYPNNCCHHHFLLNMINSNAIRSISTTSNLALIYLTLYSLLPSCWWHQVGWYDDVNGAKKKKAIWLLQLMR